MNNSLTVKGGRGNDTITMSKLAVANMEIYGEDGDDTLNIFSSNKISGDFFADGGRGVDSGNAMDGSEFDTIEIQENVRSRFEIWTLPF
jgi:hypothetical protein